MMATVLRILESARYYIDQQREQDAMDGGSNIVTALELLADAIEAVAHTSTHEEPAHREERG